MKKYKRSIIFLLKFFLSYFLLFTVYSYYLNGSQQKQGQFECAPLTTSVANQTVNVLHFFGYKAEAIQHNEEMSVKILIDEVYLARVIEGCNSISIIILFASFIIAFPGPRKVALLYAVFGSLVIYGINILRIAILTVLLYKYPNQQGFLHNLLFPAIIYGTTFLLWVVWVRRFSNYNR